MFSTELNEINSIQINQEAIDTPQQSFSNWVGRRVVYYCPRGYPEPIYLKVKLFFQILGVLSFCVLLMGGIWKDSMNPNQIILIFSAGGFGLISSLFASAVSEIIFKNQPHSR